MDNKYFIPDIEDIKEIWKDVPGYEEYYEVSNFGAIRRKAYIMKCILTKAGYPAITLCGGGNQINKTIHRLVAELFIDNPENKPQVNHIDGVKSNASASNLEWVTASENISHALKIGLKDKNWQDGEKNPQNKLTKEQVLDIRDKCKTMKISEVHRNFYPDMSYNTSYGIKKKRLWKNL